MVDCLKKVLVSYKVSKEIYSFYNSQLRCNWRLSGSLPQPILPTWGQMSSPFQLSFFCHLGQWEGAPFGAWLLASPSRSMPRGLVSPERPCHKKVSILRWKCKEISSNGNHRVMYSIWVDVSYGLSRRVIVWNRHKELKGYLYIWCPLGLESLPGWALVGLSKI